MKKVNLTQFAPIIKHYWDDFDDVVNEDKDIMSGLTTPEHSKIAVKSIMALKTLELWKQNLFILYLHFKKTTTLANELDMNNSTISVYISNIKKELKQKICSL